MINLNTRQQISNRRSINHDRNGILGYRSFNNLYISTIKMYKLMDFRGKLWFYFSILLVTGIVFLSLIEYWNNQILRDKAFLLPNNNLVINNYLLQYASSEFTGMGSGLPYPQASEIISTVKSFDYIIKEGDTLSEISKHYKIDVGTLISYNNIQDVRRIWVGANIKIPDTDGLPYIVKNGDSLESIAKKYS